MVANVYTISPSPDSTIAIETATAGLVKRKHLFVFERFHGELVYDVAQPLASVLNLTIEVSSLVFRDGAGDAKNSHGKRARLTQTALREALGSFEHPELQLQTERFVAKPLRGFVMEGKLCFRGLEHAVKANVGFGVEKRNGLQMDADAALRLSDFGVHRPSSLFGLIRTEDAVVLHALVWGIPNAK